MISLSTATRVFVAPGATDRRKSFWFESRPTHARHPIGFCIVRAGRLRLITPQSDGTVIRKWPSTDQWRFWS